ncbi:hypothetical protein CK203_088503 [Vitis vinifera]|uniref:Uncharacterized protein n=1 Tax=Vitis vinifera TaxID=29760 RepID=A0A438EZZ8_VITVI|nr:hypothetical protein CK203_088503 [Vitis vinifera]
MCGGDDHFAWKRPVSLEVCRGLRTIGGQEIGSQQSRSPVVQDETPHDSLPPPPPLPISTVPQASPYMLHGHSEVVPPVVVQTMVIMMLTLYRPSLECLTLRDTQALVILHSSSTLQHSDEGPWLGRVTDDYLIPTIFEWSNHALIRVFGVLSAQDMG